MRLDDLARQLEVEPSQLLGLAQRLGLDLDEDGSVSTQDEWALRKAAIEQPNGPSVRMPPRPVPAGQVRRREKAPEPSGYDRFFLGRINWLAEGYYNPPPKHVQVALARKKARPWIDRLFTPAQMRAWIDANGDIDADVAYRLDKVGMSPEQAATRVRSERGYVHKLTLATRVASDEITAEEAAALLAAHEAM